MITFAPAKVNLGLHVLSKRPDGFHEIETGILEIPLYDILEITKSGKFEFIQSGINVDAGVEDNLCAKAYKLLKSHYDISDVRIHLRKQIPIGAGLGGGSSDAVAVLKTLIQLFELEVAKDVLIDLSAHLGSDCPFFVDGGVQLASGRGEILKKINLDKSPCFLVLINPGIHISTKEAYSSISCASQLTSIEDILSQPISTWENKLVNDFESSIFEKHPEIKDIKKELYELGAVYASMSGSGSSVFALFKEQVGLTSSLKNNLVYASQFP
jgi:4-diphosphocytidyl-2-C-methyl-D-erythritol kinase